MAADATDSVNVGRGGVTRLVLVLMSMSLVASALPASAAAGPPSLAFEGFANGHEVVASATLKGHVLQRFADVEPFMSIDDGVVAVTRHSTSDPFASNVIGYDAETGERVYKIKDARFPLAFGNGTGVVFLPDNNGSNDPNERDPFVNSVWYRDLATGDERKLAQFTDGDLVPLQLAAAPDGSLVAFAEGDDTFLFSWDIWLATTDGSTLVQLTTDGQSLYPSFSPNGGTIAYAHTEDGDGCTTGIRVIDVDGTDGRTLTTGTCDESLTRPVWLDDDTLVAWWWAEKQDGSGFRVKGLVEIDVATGDVTQTLVAGKVVDFGVSRSLGVVVFRVRSGQIGRYDLSDGSTSEVRGGTKLFGWHLHVDGSFEQAI